MTAADAQFESRVPWIYRGVWGQLTPLFKLPDTPPTLPVLPGQTLRVFHPAEGWLRYLKFLFWIGLTVFDGILLIGWLVVLVAAPVVGLLLAPIVFAVAVLPDLVAYLVIHLRYDNTWYVLSDRSLRIRTGVWTVKEMTFTFENVQNVSITRGPLQRYFGIATVRVETAGGGGSQKQKGEHASFTNLHEGRLVGIDDPDELRELILARLRRSKSAGLGDDREDITPHGNGWSAAHTQALREIRDTLLQQTP